MRAPCSLRAIHQDGVALDTRVASRLVGQLGDAVCPAELQLMAWLLKRSRAQHQPENVDQGGATEIIAAHLRNHYFSSLSGPADQHDERQQLAASVLLFLAETPNSEFSADEILAAVKKEGAKRDGAADIMTSLGAMVDAKCRSANDRWPLSSDTANARSFVRSALLGPRVERSTSFRRLPRWQVSWGITGLAAVLLVALGIANASLLMPYLPTETVTGTLAQSNTVGAWNLLAFDSTGQQVVADPVSGTDVLAWNARTYHLDQRLAQAHPTGTSTFQSLSFNERGTKLLRTAMIDAGSRIKRRTCGRGPLRRVEAREQSSTTGRLHRPRIHPAVPFGYWRPRRPRTASCSPLPCIVGARSAASRLDHHPSLLTI